MGQGLSKSYRGYFVHISGQCGILTNPPMLNTAKAARGDHNEGHMGFQHTPPTLRTRQVERG